MVSLFLNKTLSLLKDHWQAIIITILIIIVCFLSKCTQQLQADLTLEKQSKDSVNTKVRKFYDHNKKLVAEVNSYSLTNKKLKKIGDDLGFDNKALRQQVGSLKNMRAYYKVKAIVKDTFTTPGLDTSYTYKGKIERSRKFHYDNKYMVMDQIYHPSDSSLFTEYKYNPSFQITSYVKGRTLFKRGSLVADIRFDDQNVSTQEIKSFVIKEESKKWYETGIVKVLIGFILGRVSK